MGKFSINDLHVWDIIGTTRTLSVLSALIRKCEAGIGKMFSPHVASHIIVVGPNWFSGNGITGFEMTWPRIKTRSLDPLSPPPAAPAPSPQIDVRTPRGGVQSFAEHIVFIARAADWTRSLTADTNATTYLRQVWETRTRYDVKALLEKLGIGNDDDKRMCCSELGREIWKRISIGYPPEWDQGLSPWDMQRHFEATNQIVYRSYKEFWG